MNRLVHCNCGRQLLVPELEAAAIICVSGRDHRIEDKWDCGMYEQPIGSRPIPFTDTRVSEESGILHITETGGSRIIYLCLALGGVLLFVFGVFFCLPFLTDIDWRNLIRMWKLILCSIGAFTLRPAAVVIGLYRAAFPKSFCFDRNRGEFRFRKWV